MFLYMMSAVKNEEWVLELSSWNLALDTYSSAHALTADLAVHLIYKHSVGWEMVKLTTMNL